MDIKKTFADPTLEEEGVWVNYHDGSRLKLARIGNPKFQRRLDAKMKPHRHRERNGTLDTATETRVLCECLAETIVLDWEGFTSSGKDFPYSQEAAFDLLTAHLDFRNDVVEMAGAQETFRNEGLEDDAKN